MKIPLRAAINIFKNCHANTKAICFSLLHSDTFFFLNYKNQCREVIGFTGPLFLYCIVLVQLEQVGKLGHKQAADIQSPLQALVRRKWHFASRGGVLKSLQCFHCAWDVSPRSDATNLSCFTLCLLLTPVHNMLYIPKWYARQCSLCFVWPPVICALYIRVYSGWQCLNVLSVVPTRLPAFTRYSYIF